MAIIYTDRRKPLDDETGLSRTDDDRLRAKVFKAQLEAEGRLWDLAKLNQFEQELYTFWQGCTDVRAKASLASTLANCLRLGKREKVEAPQVTVNILSDADSARRALANLGVLSDAGEVIDVEATERGGE